MSIRLEACGRTDVGIKRDNNEDAILMSLNNLMHLQGD